MTVLESLYTTLFKVYTRKDIARWNHWPECSLKIYGVYHVFCASGWQNLVSQQLDRLKESGLAKVTTVLYVSCILQKSQDLGQLKTLLAGFNYQIISSSTDKCLYEYPALDYLLYKANREDGLFYYFHTKGVSYQCPGIQTRHFRKFKRNLEAWRNVMEYYLMDRWKVAVNVLCEGYDTYGCYRYPPKPAHFTMYAGNFWWARSSYLRMLKPVDLERRSDRMLAERWLYTRNPKDFSPFDTLALLYRVFLPESLYRLKKAPFAERWRFVLLFNWTKIQKKVFHYNFIGKNNERYQKN